MTDKCYRVEFTAHLHKLYLALKMQCEIEVIWKRGEKVCESGKVYFSGGEAVFDKKISISCNMIFNTKTQIFKEKITKFCIILSSGEKGTKQAGEISFDVAEFINKRQLSKKDYEERLSGCPDKNAKLSFTLTGVLKEELGMDAISQSSYVNTDNPDQGSTKINSSTANMQKNKSDSSSLQQIPTQDRQKSDPRPEKLREIEEENRRLKEEVRASEKLRKENEELKKKIKTEDYKKSTEVKEKIEKYKKEIEKMKAEIRTNKKIEDETCKLEDDLFHCSVKIMKAFNYAREFGGDKLANDITDYCGIVEKK